MNTTRRFTDEVEVYENSINSFINVIQRLPLPYTGNKRKVLPDIYNAIKKHQLEFRSVLDAFSGSGSVSLLFKAMGKRVISNDILTSSYINSVALLGPPVKMTTEQQEYLLNHENTHKGTFVEDNYLGSQFKDTNSRYNKFTPMECKHLDNFRANIDDLPGFRLQCLGLLANGAIVQRLPFGNVDASIDVIKHRAKQKKLYGSGGPKHDRRIGIYYDSEMNLNFSKWFRKYVNDFMSVGFTGSINEDTVNNPFLENMEIHRSSLNPHLCLKTNMDVIDLLDSSITDNMDCVYFDPPYGGQSSDYASMYRFLEEYLYGKPFEDLPHYNKSRSLVSKRSYEESFVSMLDSSRKIPIWIFSYNNTSWKDIDHIVRIIGQYGRSVVVEMLNDKYRYLYRKNRGKSIVGAEYLIFAY